MNASRFPTDREGIHHAPVPPSARHVNAPETRGTVSRADGASIKRDCTYTPRRRRNYRAKRWKEASRGFSVTERLSIPGRSFLARRERPFPRSVLRAFFFTFQMSGLWSDRSLRSYRSGTIAVWSRHFMTILMAEPGCREECDADRTLVK